MDDQIQKANSKSKTVKKTVLKKKGVKKEKKEEPDTVQRFFNNYSENPHLQ